MQDRRWGNQCFQTGYALMAGLLLMLSFRDVYAHEDLHTHPALTVGAMLFLDMAHPEDGALIPPARRSAIRQGSIEEDACPNYLNHFYNPRNAEGTRVPRRSKCNANPLTDPEFPYASAATRAAVLWEEAKSAYRAGSGATAFTKLGNVFHLLQDMSSPAHVHNDIHAQFFQGGELCQDGDDFENWGWTPPECTFGPFTHIYDYIQDNSSPQLKAPMLTGLQRMFFNRPQMVSKRSMDTNIAFSFVHMLATNVYTFTTFAVLLKDTGRLLVNDEGAGEFHDMFHVYEFGGLSGGWYFEDSQGYNIWSQGECAGDRADQAWWLMQDGTCSESNCPGESDCTIDKGLAYIENTGGGAGGAAAIPDSLIPARYNRTWFRQRYNAPVGGINTGNITMLRIYGDVLYTAAVAYGAGLLQAFLDEAIMPKPITGQPTLTPVSAQLSGSVRPAGTPASAWFEWGTNTSYGTVTLMRDVGAGQASTNLYETLDSLIADTVYHYRIVSSNIFGIRYGTNQTFRTPTYLLTAQVPNAWQITDRSTAGLFRYLTNLPGPQRIAATNSGFRYIVNGRFLTSFGGNVSIYMTYGLGSQRYLIWWTLDQNGDLIANLDQAGILKLTTNGTGSSRYHTHEIVYNPGTRRASYLMDGVVKTNNWAPSSFDWPAGEIAWGAGSSSGMGQMNFHEVEFQITGVGAAVSYRAGFSGNPPPVDPVTQGWTANPSPAPPNSVASLSPDVDPYLPLIETLNASEVGLASARLNGRTDPRGKPASGWFQWGTSATYGKETQARTLGTGSGWTNYSESISGLAGDREYHFRSVVSNAFAFVFSADQVFTTAQPVTIILSEAPQAGHFRLRFTGAAGGAYQVFRSPDLVDWLPVGQPVESSPGTFEFLDTDAVTESEFYRVHSAAP